MSEFKPMVKMYTDEPSVSLKLKKGGHVSHKAHHKHHEEHGHKSMHHAVGGHMHGAHHAFESEHGKAPKKPSMHERHKAMNPNQYAKGGKVHHKLDGGMMPMARPALAAMDPAARAARAMAVRKALTGMKKGGSAGMEKHIEKLEKELHHHEALDMKHAHHHKHGGMHHKADGGAIDKAETRTTLKNSVKPFEKDKMVTAHKDKAHGTGEVHEGKPGGFKHGGHAHKKHHKATGGEIPADTHESKNKAKVVMGGTLEGNEHDYENTEMHSAKPDHAHGTKGVHMSNAGGFKHGGKMHHKASGGAIPAATQKSKREDHLKGDTYEGGNWENRVADTATAGVKGTKTGEVKESNAGGFKRGGHASKKAYATGGIVDDGRAVKMPSRIKHAPVANTMQSGTYKRGGKVQHHEYGGSTGDPMIDRETRRMEAERAAEKADNERMRETILGAPRRAYEAVKGMFGSSTPPAGSVTKTEKSVTVSPGKKRGGKC